MKPGYQTTEFWVTLFGQAIALLTTIGVFNSQDAATLGDGITKIVTAVFTLGTSALVALHYVKSRWALKAKGTP
jgi:hypothetical protein